jgi:hypothetical protein
MLNLGLNEVASQTHFTQVSSFFDIVDNMVKVGDTDKKYFMSRVPVTAPPVPISDNGWTTISLMPKGGNMVDLYNSYIFVEIQFKPEFDLQINEFPVEQRDFREPSRVWIGYKDAMDCIAQYQIHCNGEEVYSQSHALRESFLTATCLPDTVKTTDVWSRAKFEDIWNWQDTAYTGAWMKFDKVRENSAHEQDGFGNTSWSTGLPPGTAQRYYEAGGSYPETLSITLKIDFRRFLPFSAIKYLPAFVQNLQLKVQFSTRGMVVANCGWKALLTNPTTYKDIVNIDKVTSRFVPIGVPMAMYDNPDETAGAASTAVHAQFPQLTGQVFRITPETFKVVHCHSVLHTFSIDRNIYLSLVQRYTANALVFPIQTLVVNQTNGNFTTGIESQQHVDFTVQHIPRFVDAIFFFFPYTRRYETCFTDPELRNIQISMGDFGAFRFTSSTGAEFYENIQNTLNLNNDAWGMPKDLMRAYTTRTHNGMDYIPNDDTNYIFGIPCSVDNTFQQGQTSQSIVAYTFEADVYWKDVSTHSHFYNSPCIPEIGFLMDSVFAIQVIAGGGVVCRIKELDITTPTE